MKVNLETAARFIYCYKNKTNKITRVALNALVITNCCALTCLFFVSSTLLLSIASTITIIGSAILIEKIYK